MNKRRGVMLGAGITAALFLACVYGLLRFPAPFRKSCRASASAAAEVFPSWYTKPQPLTEDEAAAMQWLADITCRLPATNESVWDVGGSQHGVFSRRYQIAFTCYAAAALAARTPAYVGLARDILTNGVGRLADKRSWSYISTYWKDEPWFPDPCAKGNIMYSGHLLQAMALAEAVTGFSGYEDEGVSLVWDAEHAVRYTTSSLARNIAAQIDSGDGGITCEPGLVFFACNNHPHIAFRLLEAMGYGDFRAERSKWEQWALGHFHATLGGGAVRLLRHEGSGLSMPRGQAGFDGWSLLWYEPWATDKASALAIWEEAVAAIDWNSFGDDPADVPVPLVQKSCCNPVAVPPAANASFLAAAARACGDTVTAGRLERWLDSHFVDRSDGRFRLRCHREWQIGVTANRILAMALANGSDLRWLTISPLPREYFSGALLERVQPSDTSVYQAWRDEKGRLTIELDGHGKDVVLTFSHLSTAQPELSLPGIPSQWQPEEGALSISHCPRVIVTVLPL